MDITAKLLKLYFTESSFKFDLDKSESTSIQMQTEAELYQSKDNDDNTAMIRMKITITSVDNDNVKVEVITHSIFEFSEISRNNNDIFTTVCIPKAQEESLIKIDNILENMGYPRFNLVADIKK